MLTKFDASLITFERVKIKSVSTALGGSVTILDEVNSAAKGKEIFHRIDVPMAIARMFQVKYKMSKFFHPHEGALMRYDGKVIAIEKSVFNHRSVEGVFGDRDWLINMEKNLATVLKDHITDSIHQWYFDGSYVYRFMQDSVKTAVDAGESLDKDNRFRAVSVESIHMNYLSFSAPSSEKRICIAYVASNGEFAITAPIWKTLGSKMGTTTSRKGVEESVGLASNFNEVDNKMGVTLNFALAAGNELADSFGYNVIEPLQLPKLMVQLKTVNLPKLPKEIKATFEIGLSFTQTFAWLLGLSKIANTRDQEESVRRLMKYLTSKGIFRKDSLNQDKIYVSGTTEMVPMVTIEQAQEYAKREEVRDMMLERWERKLKTKYRDAGEYPVDYSLASELA